MSQIDNKNLSSIDELITNEASPSVRNLPFEMIERSLIQHSGLPIDSRMLIIYLISFSEDKTGWKFYDSVIRKDLDVGRDKLERMFRDLRNAGYVKNVVIRDEGGKVCGSKRIFSRIPEFLEDNRIPEKACSGESTETLENRGPGKPGPGKPAPNNTNSNNTKDLFKNSNKKINKKDFSSEFDEFWNFSQNFQKKKRASAKARFNELLNKDYSYFEIIMTKWREQVNEWEAKKTPLVYRTFPTYWLRDEGFNDEYLSQEQLNEESKRNQQESGRKLTKYEETRINIENLERQQREFCQRANEGGFPSEFYGNQLI